MAPGNSKVVGRRVVAFVFDLLLTWLVAVPLYFALATKAPRGSHPDLGDIHVRVTSNDHLYYLTGGRAVAYIAIVLVVGLAYWVALPGATGATLGQRMLGVRVVGEDGRPAGFGRNLVRQLMLIVDCFFFYLVGLLTALLSRGNQRTGDMVARTWVVRAGTQTAAAAARDAGLLASGLPHPASVPVGIPGEAPALQTGSASVEPVGATPPGTGGTPLAQPAPARPEAAPQPAAQPLPPAGWYADPSRRNRLRWWDGARWTDHTAA